MYLLSAGTVVRGVGVCSAWEHSSPTGAARSAVGRVIETGQPEVMRGWSEVLAGETHPYVAALPVFLGEEVRGALLVVGSAQDPLTVLDNRFLVALGHQVGAALANADLVRRLEERTDDLEHLAARMVEQNEEERRRLSRELHDESAQVFAAVKLQLGLLRESATPEQVPALDQAVPSRRPGSEAGPAGSGGRLRGQNGDPDGIGGAGYATGTFAGVGACAVSHDAGRSLERGPALGSLGGYRDTRPAGRRIAAQRAG